MELKEQKKYFQVRLYPNGIFKSRKINEDFQKHQLTIIRKNYNIATREEYDYLVAEEKNIKKAEQKLAKSHIREAKKDLDEAQKRFNLLTKILG